MLRVGDFYEFLDQDAIDVSEVLGVTLTGRAVEGRSERVPMCGIPVYKEDESLRKLIDAGRQVAVAEVREQKNKNTPLIQSEHELTIPQEYHIKQGDTVYMNGDPFEFVSVDSDFAILQNSLGIPVHIEQSAFGDRIRKDPHNDSLKNNVRTMQEDSGQQLEEISNFDTPDFDDDETGKQTDIKYDLGYGHFGNGLTVWNRLQQENGDYKTIAHIESDRAVTFYDRNIPEEVRKRIYEVAGRSDMRMSDTQDAPVFSTSPEELPDVAHTNDSDAEIAKILPQNGADILRFYEHRFSDDRFYVDRENGKVTWLYFNPDSTSGGQFVENIVTFEQIAELKDTMDDSEFFDKLGAEAKQYLVDCDDEDFKDAAYHYLTDEYTFRGYDSKTMEQLISFVEGITNQRDGDEESRETTKEIPNNSRPEIPDREKHNYRITDDEIGMGGAKEKFRKNITAIKLLYQLESENRLATPEEQEILAQYSGWGGLADAFDERINNWHSEYVELKNLLSTEEYEAVRENTLTAFYTPPVVIKAIYRALENMGFKRGNILEIILPSLIQRTGIIKKCAFAV